MARRPFGPEAPSPEGSGGVAAAATERGNGFSLFSWLRREPDGEAPKGDKET